MSEVRGQMGKTTSGAARFGWASRIRFTPALLLATVFGASACAAPVGEDTQDDARVAVQTDTDPQIYGGAKDDDASSVPGVVALRVGTGGTFELCTGTLVAPNLVLTARHCVVKQVTTSVACDENGRSANGPHVASDHDPRSVGIYVGGAPNFAKAPASLARAIVAPKGAYLCDADIALVVLDKPITTSPSLAVRLSGATTAGERIRSVGYGQNDDKMPIGTRFRKTGVAILAQGKAVSANQTPLGAHEFEVGKSICQGDSGGPAISEATGAVIGVVSRGGNCNEDFGHIYTTTAGFAELFNEAFAIAGATPVRETRDADVTVAPQSEPASADAQDATDGASCAVGRPGSVPASSGLGALVALGAILAIGRRKRA